MPLFLHALAGLVPATSRGGAAEQWTPRWLLYGYLAPSPPVARPVVAKTQTVPGIGTERAVMEKTLLDVQKEQRHPQRGLAGAA